MNCWSSYIAPDESIYKNNLIFTEPRDSNDSWPDQLQHTKDIAINHAWHEWASISSTGKGGAIHSIASTQALPTLSPLPLQPQNNLRPQPQPHQNDRDLPRLLRLPLQHPHHLPPRKVRLRQRDRNAPQQSRLPPRNQTARSPPLPPTAALRPAPDAHPRSPAVYPRHPLASPLR